MRTFLSIVILSICLIFLEIYYEKNRYPYEEGVHLGYSIEIENGFVYKIKGNGFSSRSIQVLNSDGTPLRYGHKIY